MEAFRKKVSKFKALERSKLHNPYRKKKLRDRSYLETGELLFSRIRVYTD